MALKGFITYIDKVNVKQAFGLRLKESESSQNEFWFNI